MQIEIKTNKNFTAAVNRLAEKYGEKFADLLETKIRRTSKWH